MEFGSLTTLAIVGLVGYLLYSVLYGTDIPFIKGIPRLPVTNLPLFGHLIALGEDHATACQRWAKQYKLDVFQMRMGNRRAVVFNTFDVCKELLLQKQTATIDRPMLFTFHSLISSTQGYTIGSSPWDESCKNKRKAVGVALGRPMLRQYIPMFDYEGYCLLRDIYRDSNRFADEISVRPYIQRLALNTTLTLCYGIRMDNVYDSLLREILTVGSAISLLRSSSENFQDYVPLLRWFPNNEKNARAKDLRARRDKYLNVLLDKVRQMIKDGTDKPCIAAAILKDDESKLTNVEVGSICLSIVSGGFETIPGTLTSCIGSLSEPRAWKYQEKAYAAIKEVYPDVREAFVDCVKEEKVPYIMNIAKEAMRYYTVSNMSLPRQAITDIKWHGATIPKGTMLLVNAQAANHDESHFGPDAAVFDPDRWDNIKDGLGHFSFGGGSRMCSGQFIATRILYAAITRCIIAGQWKASKEFPPNTDYIDYNAIKSALVAIPRDFKVKIVPRDQQLFEEMLSAAAVRTAEDYVQE